MSVSEKQIVYYILMSPVLIFLAWTFFGWAFLTVVFTEFFIQSIKKLEIFYAFGLVLFCGLANLGWLGLAELLIYGGVGFKKYRVLFLLSGVLSISTAWGVFYFNDTQRSIANYEFSQMNLFFVLAFGGVHVLVALIGISLSFLQKTKQITYISKHK